MTLLELDAVHAGYDETPVLRGISLRLEPGSVLALLGRNGMGKTTTVRVIAGLMAVERGEVRLRARDITREPAHRRAQMGIGMVPETRQIFPSCTVREHLTMAARGGEPESSWTLERLYATFPVLEKRARARGGELSGGEQQMLAIARALSTNPDVLLLDEPTEGLAPSIVQEIAGLINQLKADRRDGAMLLVEQNVPLALSVADHVAVLRKGEIVYAGTVDDFKSRPDISQRFIGVG
jgi:branched-chain amino acid transport system ATP-binding protein